MENVNIIKDVFFTFILVVRIRFKFLLNINRLENKFSSLKSTQFATLLSILLHDFFNRVFAFVQDTFVKFANTQ